MSKSRMLGAALMSVAVIGMWSGTALSQDAGAEKKKEGAATPAPSADSPRRGNRGGEGGGPGGGPGGGDFRTRWNDMLKAGLHATEDEWKVLQPRLEKVGMAQMAMRSGFGRGFGRGGRGPGGGDAPQTEIGKAVDELKAVLDKEDSKPEEVKAKVEAVRAIRAKAKAELEAAQKELRELVSVKQEAYLVMIGSLE